MIYFEIECQIESNNDIKIINNYNLGHYNDMRNDSSLIDWIPKLTLINDDISQQWNLFTDEIRNLEKKHIPQKSINNHPHKSKGVPLDPETRKLIRRKDRL